MMVYSMTLVHAVASRYVKNPDAARKTPKIAPFHSGQKVLSYIYETQKEEESEASGCCPKPEAFFFYIRSVPGDGVGVNERMR